MDEPRADALLINGVYGTGKTTVMAEMADILEAIGIRYAAIDLDWLAWANIDDGHGDGGHQLMLANLAPMVDHYRAAGIERFILAQWISLSSRVNSLRSTIEMPMRVVRLTLDPKEIERRLLGDPTSGRADDLQVAQGALASSADDVVADLVIANDRPLREVATTIVEWSAWT